MNRKSIIGVGVGAAEAGPGGVGVGAGVEELWAPRDETIQRRAAGSRGSPRFMPAPCFPPSERRNRDPHSAASRSGTRPSGSEQSRAPAEADPRPEVSPFQRPSPRPRSGIVLALTPRMGRFFAQDLR